MSAHRLLHDLYLDGAPYVMDDPGDTKEISPDRQLCVVKLTTSAAETRTLADPKFANQRLLLQFYSDSGDCVITADSQVDQSANKVITLDDEGDWIELVGVDNADSLEWRVVASEGVSGVSQSQDELTVSTLDVTTITSSTGVGAKNGATVSASESGDGILHKTVLTCTATPLTFGDEAGVGQYGGVKVYDFPEGLILTLGAVIDGSMTLTAPAIDTWDGDIGLGVEAPTDHTDAANKIGQILQSTATTTAVGKVATVDAVSAATALTESGARWKDGTGTAIDLYLNLLVDDDAAHDNSITGTFTGTITILWLNLGDK